MAKRHFDKGTDTLLAPTFAPGEHLVAATRATNDGYEGGRNSLTVPLLPGGLIVGAVRAAARSGGIHGTPKTPYQGMAGTVPEGELLVALTNWRLFFFPCKGPQVLVPPVDFQTVQLRSATCSFSVMKMSFEFDDRSAVQLHLPKTDYNARDLARLLQTMIGEVRPPDPVTRPERPLAAPAEPPPPGDWLASPQHVVDETARFAQLHPPRDPPNDPENENP